MISARSRHELAQLTDSLVIHLAQIVGLLLDAGKTVVLTTHAQPPPILATDGPLQLTILEREVGVACWQLRGRNHNIYLEYHL